MATREACRFLSTLLSCTSVAFTTLHDHVDSQDGKSKSVCSSPRGKEERDESVKLRVSVQGRLGPEWKGGEPLRDKGCFPQSSRAAESDNQSALQ